MSVHNPRTKNELRCFCNRKPLLGMYGINKEGKLYFHVKVYKQDRIYCELVIHEGKISFKCRDCFRWHNIRLIGMSISLYRDIQAPEEVATDKPGNAPRIPVVLSLEG